MARALKTTMYLDPEEYERIKDIARLEGRLPAELFREALAQYVARKGTVRRPKSIGVGHSGKRNVGARAEQLLKGFGE